MTQDNDPIEPEHQKDADNGGTALVPLTTVVDGKPQVVYDELGQIVLTEVPHERSATHILVPLTAVVGGEPELVWDSNNELVLTEIPRPAS